MARPAKQPTTPPRHAGSNANDTQDSPLPARLLLANNKKITTSEPLIPQGVMPSYLADAFQELYEEDGLVCLARGLGWLQLLASFVRFYADVHEGHLAILEDNDELEMETPTASVCATKKPPLVLVIGLRQQNQEYDTLLATLESWGTIPEMLPIVITNESGQSKDRAAMYAKGGVFCITSRILIVDLLTKTISCSKIDGILIAHADQVTNESTEAFIIRIYTTQKRRNHGFIKAFCDSPDGLLQGFAKVDKTLKALHVRRLYLYPRFHDSVRTELESNQPIVEELYQPLSPKMKEIQNAIVAAVQTCMRELKGSTPFVEWNGEDLSIENCVTSSFDRAVSRQLEQDWHRLKPQTKQLVQDLRTLRTLFQSLIQYDCVSFWKLINSIKTLSAASRHPSMWLLSAAADVLFRKAKERIYKIQRGRPTTKVPNPVGTLIPILEENPKWGLLRKVVDEILVKEDAKKEQQQQSDDAQRSPPTILIMVKEERTVKTLKRYLMDGKQTAMLFYWHRYLENYNDRSRSKADIAMSEESRLLLEEEGRVRRLLFGRDSIIRDNAAPQATMASASASRKRGNPYSNQSAQQMTSPGGAAATTLNAVPDYIRKRRKIAMEKSRGMLSSQRDDLDRRAVLDEAIEETEQSIEALATAISESPTKLPKLDANDDDDENDIDDDTKKTSSESLYDSMFAVQKPREPQVLIRTFSSIDGDHASMLLSDLQPNYVIMYDNDLAFVRSLEVHSSLFSTQEQRLRVYFLVFEASAEQKRFMKALAREQSAFERLIHHKKTMPPPILQVEGTQEMQVAIESGDSQSIYGTADVPLAFDTRQGKGRAKPNEEKRDVAVDVREFRSALPSILHQGGMRLAPVTLTVGDFVLSSVHCVERKSISDLFGSFASGRLYTQAEAMSKFYKCPCLLIEFDPTKSFCLQNSNELGLEIRNDSICSKMAILTMHFPKLRILWSKSPHETLHMFRALKQNHEEVDVERAMEVGRSESVEYLLNNGGDEDEINETARDMLLRLPGVNMNNARKIMQECDTIAELSEMSRDDLRRIAGPVAGQKLFTFFRRTCG